jgi:hypothetical protein
VGVVREPSLPVAEQKQAAAAAMAERKQESAEQFEREYAYVVRDLQHIFVLAAIMFILLIVLNLLLR